MRKRKKHRPLRICVGASAGGHMNQLLKLLEASESWPEKPYLYVTTLEALAAKIAEKGQVYVIGECNRRQPVNAIRVLARCFKIAVRERPDVIVTTGSLPLAMLCFWAALFGARIVWIDSIANVERLSMSGAFVRTFADLFLTQWPELARRYKNVEYAGAIV